MFDELFTVSRLHTIYCISILYMCCMHMVYQSTAMYWTAKMAAVRPRELLPCQSNKLYISGTMWTVSVFSVCPSLLRHQRSCAHHLEHKLCSALAHSSSYSWSFLHFVFPVEYCIEKQHKFQLCFFNILYSGEKANSTYCVFFAWEWNK